MVGQRIGYIRVSTIDQNVERQLEGIALDRTFSDKASGKDTKWPQLDLLMSYARDGDTVVVHSMDRLARNLEQQGCDPWLSGSLARTSAAYASWPTVAARPSRLCCGRSLLRTVGSCSMTARSPSPRSGMTLCENVTSTTVARLVGQRLDLLQ